MLLSERKGLSDVEIRNHTARFRRDAPYNYYPTLNPISLSKHYQPIHLLPPNFGKKYTGVISGCQPNKSTPSLYSGIELF